ncbi:SCO family protein [Halorubrum sp. SY-15]|jgi:protein SCO1/2|uniref:SCO family protein n=1 Tax=Halorubrum sp. SY-15 TaxID=3402277 RepID=UPI003EBF6059
MYRRTVLGGMGAAATGGLAGCTSRLFGTDTDGVVLGPQEDQLADSEDLSYPAYGQPLPAFELDAPLADATIDSTALDRTAIVTAIFTSCPAECGILLYRLAGVQRRIAEAGMTDAVVFLPISFDPERDDAAAFRANAETLGIDLSAGNWHYLLPETPAEAKTVVEERLGIGFERTTQSDRLEGYDFTHAVVTLLVNPDGVVERAYRGEQIDRDRVTGDLETVVAAFAESS